MKTLAIIPAAGRGSRMLSLTDNCPKSMIPVANKPLISYLLDQLIDNGFTDVCIIVGYKKEMLKEYVEMLYKDKLNITFVEQTELLGLGHAIYVALNHIDINKYDDLFIMLGDSIFTDNDVFKCRRNKESYIVCGRVDDYSRWCIAKRLNSKVVGFIDKPQEEPDEKLAVLGAYYFNDIAKFKKAADESIESGIRIKGEYQISTIMLNYDSDISILEIFMASYFDFGELDAYTMNKKRFNQSRFFNDIGFNDDKILKKSTNYHKLQREIMWFLAMPQNLKDLYCATLSDYSLDDSDTYYCTNYANGSTLQEMWLYNNLSEETWTKILKEVATCIDDFYHSSYIHKSSKDLKTFLLTNINNRMPKIEECFNELNIDCKEEIKAAKKAIKQLNPSSLQIIHGDMVFSNIIYDFTSNKITLIDPRGDFNGDIIYGDRRYDLAKLCQCIIGDYDYIVNDLFTIDGDVYTIYNNKSMSYKTKVFNKLMNSMLLFNVDIKEIYLITAIQFLTMIPLHAENKNHQRMMAIKFKELLKLAEVI